jgi:lysophospholipase L1-like esterase
MASASSTRLSRGALALSLCLLAVGCLRSSGRRVEPHWIASWAASPQPAAPPLRVDDQTLRQIVRLSLGGTQLRLRLSNVHGTTPLQIGAAHVAFSRAGSAVVSGSDRVLTFDGRAGVTLAPGAQAVSDPLPLLVSAATDLAVSLYFPGAQRVQTEHATAEQTTYLSTTGDFSGSEDFRRAGSSLSWYVIAGVDVESVPGAQLIVAFGDSITDGMGSTPDANHRWPDWLAERLRGPQGGKSGKARAVVNAGISGNALLQELAGASALDRLERDVLTQPGVKYVVVLLGINDIIVPSLPDAPAATAAQLIAGHRQIVDRAHALGLAVFGGTITPFGGTQLYSAAGEAKRQAVNQWIRTSGAYDAVIDFERVLRDPQQPTFVLPAFDSGDRLHPNDLGYKAMADAVDLSLFNRLQ